MAELIVPWVVSWSEEERFEIRPCRTVDGKLAVWQPWKPRAGKPLFSKPHTVRQRKSVREMLCTVCGQHMEAGDRWHFGTGEVQDTLWTTTEGPLHRKCADLAYELCPHLSTRGIEPMRWWGGHDILWTIMGGEKFERDFGLKTHGRTVFGPLKYAWHMDKNLARR